MAITPIERFSMTTKSQEAGNVKAVHQIKESNGQNNIVNSYAAFSERKLEKTNQKDGVADSMNRFDAKNKGNGQYESPEERERKKREKKMREEKERKEMMGSSFNITI